MPTSAHWDEHHHPTSTDHSQVVGAGPGGQITGLFLADLLRCTTQTIAQAKQRMTSHSRVEVPMANLKTPLARPDLQAHYIMEVYWRTAMRAEQCWPGGISGLRRCSGSSGAWRGKPTRDAPYGAPQLSPLGRPRETRAILNGIDADGIRFATAIREIVSGNRRFESEVAAMTAKGSHAHHHLFHHRIPAPGRRGRPRNPACMRQKRIRDQPPRCGPAPTTEAQAPAADSPGREPDHGASR
jgi:hypothetical protein